MAQSEKKKAKAEAKAAAGATSESAPASTATSKPEGTAGGPVAPATPEPQPPSNTLPKQLQPTVDAAPIDTKLGSFDLDDPVLPAWIEESAFKSGGYPYDKPLKSSKYDEDLQALQIELVKLQHHVIEKGLKLVLVFEGRDAAGKGGAIFAFRQYLNPRVARDVALPKPTETERGQWYFQRYVAELPTAGEIVTFDRSWYNRAGVEPVMGFCTPEENKQFLSQAPRFESLLVESGTILFKFWLDIGQEMQMKRFHERRHNPLKIWKLSPMDYAAIGKWKEYSKARDTMLEACHHQAAPWTIVLANDKKRARLNLIRHVLDRVDYPGRDRDVIGKPDPLVVGQGLPFLKRN
ncbi:polyphosphate kinase 2 [Kaistia dalseonensis]|uniref:ADP/GDP-polyphosphate phosphotransferase n=1 Tax=Kaistia dalseonensis TaxID=410840 RepID=A0ABU0HDP1_9HYPH|nr:polyphosphate kinase 2 [Kaistia dalseonensis]MCX5497756.1 polyphosphate kinase 2 [Kaistia dalseonensis]MDQ0440400.1 polyphosphate kinase 2 [Kaistia dalseonensis]